ncbi:MAG: ABC transporter permease subunit [Bacteroidota bacterium]
MISSPSDISNFIFENYSSLLSATAITFLESFLGFAIATFFSFSLMFICFYFNGFMNFILPVIIISQVIPLITLAPLFIILFGVGVKSKIMMASLLCFFPIFINFANGVRLINKEIKEISIIYNASTLQKVLYIYFPLSLPNIMAGMKIASTLAVIGAIVAEFNGAEIGLGKNLFLSAKRLEPELMMSSLLLSSLLGGALYCQILLIEKKLGKWYIQ